MCTETCGDGFNHHHFDCDDGNTNNGDGCSSTCTIETYWTCTGGSPTTADTCYAICGDGRTLGTETCDDGNRNHYDG